MNKFILIINLIFMGLGVIAQNAPGIDNLSIAGAACYNTAQSVGTTVTIIYNYSDSDGDIEEGSTYIWYEGSQANGSDKTSTGITTKSYDVQSGDQYLFCEVTPKDESGQSGDTKLSDGVLVTNTTMADATVAQYYAPADGLEVWDYISASNGKSISVYSGRTFYIYGDLDLTAPNGQFDLNISGDFILYGKLITNNNVNINVYSGGSFTIYEGLDAKNGSDLKISGDLDIIGAVDFDGTTSVDVYSGAGLNIQGNINLGDQADVKLSGDINVDGDLTFDGQAKIDVYSGSSLDVAGNLDIGDRATVVVSGDINVDGDLDTGSNSDITIYSGGNVGVGGDLLGDAIISGDGTMTVGGTVDPNINDTNDVITPIKLLSVNAFYSNNNVTITWQTASEENNDYFTIERSADGVTYEIIGTVKGAGNSCVTLNYSYIDNNPLNWVSYYRLTQTDYDGRFEVFAPVSVSLLKEGNLKVGPNPVADYLNLNMGANTGSYVVAIYNLIGARVKNLELSQSYATVDVSELPKGQYIVVITANDNRMTKKIVVQ